MPDQINIVVDVEATAEVIPANTTKDKEENNG